MTNLDDVSYDRLIWKRCGVAPEGTEPEDKLLNVIVYFMSLLEADIFSGIPRDGKQNRYESRDWDGRGKYFIGSGRDRE